MDNSCFAWFMEGDGLKCAGGREGGRIFISNVVMVFLPNRYFNRHLIFDVQNQKRETMEA